MKRFVAYIIKHNISYHEYQLRTTKMCMQKLRHRLELDSIQAYKLAQHDASWDVVMPLAVRVRLPRCKPFVDAYNKLRGQYSTGTIKPLTAAYYPLQSKRFKIHQTLSQRVNTYAYMERKSESALPQTSSRRTYGDAHVCRSYPQREIRRRLCA